MSQYSSSSAPSQSPPTNTMALVSLIFGILGLIGVCPGLGAIVAIVTGYMAQNEIRAKPGAYSGEGMAKIGIILGIVGIVLVCLGVCVGVAYWAIMMGVLSSSGFDRWSLLLL